MTVSFPRTDILTAVAFQDQNFRLVSRQELSRQANGITRGKDFGSAIWMADYTTIALYNDDAVAYEAALNSLDGVVHSFEAGDLRRPFPRDHQDGSFTDDATIFSVTSGKVVRFADMTNGQKLSAGDYLSFDYGTSRALHQVVEGGVVSSQELTIEVRPYVRPGWTLGAPVNFNNPKGLFTLLPGSIESRLQGGLFTVISFKAVQDL